MHRTTLHTFSTHHTSHHLQASISQTVQGRLKFVLEIHTFIPYTSQSPQTFTSQTVQGYLALVREVRSSRLNEMLDQTGTCLSTFAQRLGLETLLQQHAHATRAGPSRSATSGSDVAGCRDRIGDEGGGSGCGAGRGVLHSSEMWAALSRALVADIEEQPRMLEEVTLRDYQMQVCGRVQAFVCLCVCVFVCLCLCVCVCVWMFMCGYVCVAVRWWQILKSSNACWRR